MKRVKRVKKIFDRTRSKFAKEEENATTSSPSSYQMQSARSSDMEI